MGERGSRPTCRDCGKPIRFEKNQNGRWYPVDPRTGAGHSCEIDRACESCGKAFQGPSWKKLCFDCFKAQRNGEKPRQAHQEPASRREDLGEVPDDDIPPF